MRRHHAWAVMLISCGLLTMTGCSTLGISCFPSSSAMSSETREILDASRVPRNLAREKAITALPPHQLQPGDTLLVEPIDGRGDLRLPADQTVLADGTLDLGAYGRVVVAGRSLEQAETMIEQQITFQIEAQRRACDSSENTDDAAEPDRGPDCDDVAVNVQLLQPIHRYYVLGEVNAPGAYPLSGYETVLDGIVAAGGLSSSANPCNILLARPSRPGQCRTTLPVCYTEITQLGSTTTNYQLRPGDRIFVASRSCLDELMFWRAYQPCERCNGCNRACRYPADVDMQNVVTSQQTMLPPGSRAYSDQDETFSFDRPTGQLSDAPLDPPTDATDSVLSDGTERTDAPLRQALPNPASPSDAGQSGTDLRKYLQPRDNADGQLDFERGD